MTNRRISSSNFGEFLDSFSAKVFKIKKKNSLEIFAHEKNVEFVDLVKSFPMNMIYFDFSFRKGPNDALID